MNPSDEEIQRALEQGRQPQGDDQDIKAYQRLFEALEREPASPLPSGFAARTVARLVQIEKRRERKDYLWFSAGVLFLAIAFAATLMYTGLRLEFGFLSGIEPYKGLIVFGAVFIAFLNWLDKRVVRKRAEGASNSL